MSRITTRSFLFSLALLALPLALTGCTHQYNDRGYVGVDPDLVAPSSEGSRDSTNALNRDQWSTTTVYIPVDGTAHRPTYNSNRRPTQVTARQRGEYPTIQTALELEEDSIDAQIAEAPIALGRAVIDAVSIPGGLVMYHQGMTRWSPDISYQRVQRQETVVPAFSTEGPGVVVPVQISETLPQSDAPPATDAPVQQSVPVSRQPIGQMTPVEAPE